MAGRVKLGGRGSEDLGNTAETSSTVLLWLPQFRAAPSSKGRKAEVSVLQSGGQDSSANLKDRKQ